MANYLDEALQFQSPQFTAVNYEAPDAVDIDSASKYMTPETKVASQLEQLLSGDNPLMQIAETRARERANQMGLLSSSMAIGTAQREQTREMLPIAIQDAASAVQFGSQQQQAEGQRQLDLQRGLVSGALQGQQAGLQTGLIGAQGQVNQQLAQQQGRIQSQLQQEQGQIQYDLTTLEGQIRHDLQVLDQQFKENLAGMDIDARARESLGQYTAGLADRMMASIAEIQMNPDIKGTAKQIAIDNIETMYFDEMNTLSAIYGVTLDWGPGSEGGGGGGGGTHWAGPTGSGSNQAAQEANTPTPTPTAHSITNLYGLVHAINSGQVPPPPESGVNRWGGSQPPEIQDYIAQYGVSWQAIEQYQNQGYDW